MKTAPFDTSSLGHEFTLNLPKEWDDLCEIMPAADAFGETLRSLLYRSGFPKLRESYYEKIEAGENVKLKPLTVDDKGNAKSWPKDSECQKQLARDAGIPEDQIVVRFQKYMDEAAAEFDFAEAIKRSTREGATLAKEWTTLADTVIAGVEEKRGGDWSKFVENMSTLVPNVTFANPDQPTREEVGRILKRYNDAQKKLELATKF